MRLFAALTMILAFGTAAMAQDLRLCLPLDCTLGETCFIQQYVDTDPGPGARDFTGGPLSYDGHQGTDIRVPDRQAMTDGVPILAPAAGRVRGVRDGVPDGTFPDGQDCGNGVAIDHGNGWETQLCHLSNGSVQVAVGDILRVGQPIAEMGMTGRTQFPHVHITVRQNGTVVDPFTADLWQAEPDYEPGGLLRIGFADAIPDYQQIKDGTAEAETLPVTAPALVLWAYMFGGREGDIIEMTVTDSDGQSVFETEVTLDRTQAQLFRAAGQRLSDPQWQAGRHTGTVVLKRDGVTLDSLVTDIVLGVGP
ncbi:M23 family metallopeptidase [Jannaschia donghaensis]|uniref:Putative peptidase n=1 Tax=Jannaschia donghaensis TaxID=420998 RepID=A0A0M6YGI0_9RHOB|nr:M23 family metallopeptidase [Jannaschia donghaensis]CTQ48186.1 putative peptidase [Jannaschia donghaensis]